jgi:hypothetical protein
MEIIHERSRACLADLTTQASRLAANLSFDVVELSDPLDGLASNGRSVGHMDVVELAPCMSPACVRVSPGKGEVM